MVLTDAFIDLRLLIVIFLFQRADMAPLMHAVHILQHIVETVCRHAAFQAVDLTLLQGILFVQIVDFALLAPVHLLLTFHVVPQIADLAVLRFVPVLAHFNSGILMCVMPVISCQPIFQIIDGGILFLVRGLQLANLAVLLFIPICHAVQSAVLCRVAQVVLFHVVFQVTDFRFVFFDSLPLFFNIFLQAGHVLPIFVQIFNLIILPFFMLKCILIVCNMTCRTIIPPSSIGGHPAQGKKDGAGEERGEDGAFQRAAGLFLLTSAPPLCVIAVNEFGAHHVAAARGVPYDFVNSVHLRFPFSVLTVSSRRTAPAQGLRPASFSLAAAPGIG